MHTETVVCCTCALAREQTRAPLLNLAGTPRPPQSRCVPHTRSTPPLARQPFRARFSSPPPRTPRRRLPALAPRHLPSHAASPSPSSHAHRPVSLGSSCALAAEDQGTSTVARTRIWCWRAASAGVRIWCSGRHRQARQPASSIDRAGVSRHEHDEVTVPNGPARHKIGP